MCERYSPGGMTLQSPDFNVANVVEDAVLIVLISI